MNSLTKIILASAGHGGKGWVRERKDDEVGTWKTREVWVGGLSRGSASPCEDGEGRAGLSKVASRTLRTGGQKMTGYGGRVRRDPPLVSNLVGGRG